ncbi:MAG: recombinase family protein [Planctomycetes bacterium]|nr:recombinase family protein [Planctomycetota bacterium]
MIRKADAQDDIKRVAIYCRVSTDKQASKEDSSLDTQKDRLVRYVEDKRRAGCRWELAYEFIEGEDEEGKRHGASGKDLKRPSFERMMQKVRARLVDVVLFTKMDRISRSVVDFLTLVEEFERHDVRLISLKEEINTSSASGRVMTTIMIALAQFEREQISERTREKMAWRAGKGLPIGPPALGYEMHEKRYRVNPKEAETVRFIERAYLEERSIDRVMRILHRKGIRSRKGRTITKNTVSWLLRNPLYTGRILYQGEEFPGQHEAIRDGRTHAEILAIMRQNTHAKGNGRTKAQMYHYLLQGLLVCGFCRGRMTPKSGHGRAGKPYHYYVCSRANKTGGLDCKTNYLDAVEADRHVLDRVKGLALRDDLVLRLCSETDERFREALETLKRDRACVKERLSEVSRRSTNLAKAVAQMDEGVPKSLLAEAKALEKEEGELEASLSRLGEEIAQIEGRVIRGEVTGETVRHLSAILGHPGATPERVKDLLPRFIDYVVWRKAPKSRKKGHLEVALFERPFRSDRGREVTEVVRELAEAEPGGSAPDGSEPGQNGRGVAPEARMVRREFSMG